MIKTGSTVQTTKKIVLLFRVFKSISLSIIGAVATNPNVVRFTENHPDLFSFIRQRLNQNSFPGLPLTILLVALGYVFMMFFGTIEDVITSDVIVAADMRIANLMFAFRDDDLVDVFTWITVLAKWEIVVSSAIVFSVILLLWRKKVYLLPLWAAFAGSEYFNSFWKLVLHRPRPDVALYAEESFSFPSGHANAAVVFYGFLAYVLCRHIKQWKYRFGVLFSGIALILAIGASRLYLGVHYLSDVWGGYLLGAFWLLIGIIFSEWLKHRQPLPPFAVPRKLRMAVLILVFAELVLFVSFTLHYNPPVARRAAPRVTVIANGTNIFQDRTIPRFTESLTGGQQEPLSFIMISSNAQLFVDAFQSAGWQRADPATFASVMKLIRPAILNKEYATAPLLPSFWNSKVHDYGFEKSTASQSVRARHHARFWRTQYVTQAGDHVFVGTASLDAGLKWLVTHTIQPDIDTERDLLFSDLVNAGAVADYTKEIFVKPTLGKNFSGDQFFTDGNAYLIQLKMP